MIVVVFIVNAYQLVKRDRKEVELEGKRKDALFLSLAFSMERKASVGHTFCLRWVM